MDPIESGDYMSFKFDFHLNELMITTDLKFCLLLTSKRKNKKKKIWVFFLNIG